VTAPYRQPGDAVAFWVLFGLFVLGECAMSFRSHANGGGAPSNRWSTVVVVVTIGGGLVGGFLLAQWSATQISAGRWSLFALGLVMMTAGLGIRQWAILTLGRFFTADVRVQADQTVVDRGPYRWVRHPAYTGLLLFFAGVGLALSNWASLIVLITVPAAGLLARIHSEERVLLTELGEPYRRYACTRRRLFPGVW
jgi:protein-S-isoprenylcysteine O-methyltransferase Ste14